MTANLPNSAPKPDASDGPSLAARIRNLLIVVVAIALSTAVFFGLQTQASSTSLEALAEAATPLNVALANDKPTLIEFYANWCTSCQAMADDMGELEHEYGDRVNFVMLNVDNTKWLPEMLQYRVDGIPHFIFMNPEGGAIASTIGEQPKTIMAANLDALSTGASLPYVQVNGQVSKVESPSLSNTASDDPRSHGG
ncbi:MAG TPA: thioredoxin family protein [Crinalium sp.]|jgi:thiol-disulfide isomerase/thioredoxin